MTLVLKNGVRDSVSTLEHFSRRIIEQINPSAPLSLKEGGLFNKGVDKELDVLVNWSENSQKMILKMENEERKKTNIPSLKIRYNQVFGYSIEVTKVHIGKVPVHYFRKQTLTQAERYTTKELQSLEEKVLMSRAKRAEREYAMFSGSFGKIFILVFQKFTEWPVLSMIWMFLPLWRLQPWREIIHGLFLEKIYF